MKPDNVLSLSLPTEPLAPGLSSRCAVARLWLVAKAIREGEVMGRPGKVNARTLATWLEVSTKTIDRDVELLRDRLGHEIVYDATAWTFRYQSLPLVTYL